MAEDRILFLSELKKVNFSQLLIERISISKLMESETVMLMTRLRSHKDSSMRIHFSSDSVFDAGKDYIDALFVTVFGRDLVIVSWEDDKTFPVEHMNTYKEQFTMTQFKREDWALKLYYCSDEVIEKIKITPSKFLHLWEYPYLLRAQTHYDMDFRKEWWGDDLVYEGNNYGDTSDFMVLGFIREENPKKQPHIIGYSGY